MELFPFQDEDFHALIMALANENNGTGKAWICIQLTELMSGIGTPKDCVSYS